LFNNAVVNGLFLPSPSEAVAPAFAANATSVSVTDTSYLARPRPIERVATVRRMVLAKGLSRQASSITSFSFFAPSIAAITWSSGTASNWMSRSTAILASTGMR
jgi:hypothetical protein